MEMSERTIFEGYFPPLDLSAIRNKIKKALKEMISFVGAVSYSSITEAHYTTSSSLALHSHHFNN